MKPLVKSYRTQPAGGWSAQQVKQFCKAWAGSVKARAAMTMLSPDIVALLLDAEVLSIALAQARGQIDLRSLHELRREMHRTLKTGWFDDWTVDTEGLDEVDFQSAPVDPS